MSSISDFPDHQKDSLGGDSGKLLLAVSQLSGNGQFPLSTNGHAVQSLVPTFNDFSSTQDEREWCTGSVGVELLSVGQFTNVSNISFEQVKGQEKAYRMESLLPGLATGPSPVLTSSYSRPEARVL